MKSITRGIAALVVLVAMVVTPVLAQYGGGQGMGPHHGEDRGDRVEARISHLQESLSLTEPQVAQLEEILKDQQAVMRTHREATSTAIEGILTDDQKATFKEMRNWTGSNDSAQMRMRDGAIDDLNLTDEQKVQFDAMRESHRAAMKAWREQNPEASEEDFMAFRDQLHKSGRASLASTLSPEQLEKFDAMHQRHGASGDPKGMRSMAGRMAEQLNLTDEQKAQIDKLRMQQCQTMRDGVQSILTPEQFDKFKNMRGEGMHGGNRNGGMMEDCWK